MQANPTQCGTLEISRDVSFILTSRDQVAEVQLSKGERERGREREGERERERERLEKRSLLQTFGPQSGVG